MNRRNFIKFGAAGGFLLQMPFAALAKKAGQPQRKMIWLVLRGAMDSLHAVVPHGDPYLTRHREALVKPIQSQLLPLNKQFSLHPALKNMHAWYQQGHMAPIVAVASPHRGRSHFDAQDMLESGLDTIDLDSGWLARAFEQRLKAQMGEAMAIAHSAPISLRGQIDVHTLYPPTLPEVEPDIYQRLATLYANDPVLSMRLEQGMEARNMMSMDGKKGKQVKFSHLAKFCAELMVQRPRIDCAMLEMDGWDTHNAQARRLDRQFKRLDEGLGLLKATLGKEWGNTVIVVATEFGRTVAVNGTQGTDHGTASALFIAGGAVAGGKVFGQWPGLAPHQLHEKRDLKPTSDIRSWFATVLMQHWRLNKNQANQVFPGVTPARQRLVV